MWKQPPGRATRRPGDRPPPPPLLDVTGGQVIRYTLFPGAAMHIGAAHPLAFELGPPWRWFHDPVHVTTILHGSGLHVDFDCDLLWSTPARANWPALALAMTKAAAAGQTGLRYVVERETDSGGPMYELWEPPTDGPPFVTWTGGGNA